MPPNLTRTLGVTLMLLPAALAEAAYFHDAHRGDALQLSDFSLKQKFVVAARPTAVALPAADAAAIVAAPTAKGLFEQQDGIHAPLDACGEDSPKGRRCELERESRLLTAAKGAAVRKGHALTLRADGGATLVVEDWQKCARGGECDGERFTYLGRLAPSSYVAVEIGYGHDSPSLILFQSQSGKIVSVHYGSEATDLSPTGSLLFSSEDLNDATSLLVTSLGLVGPEIDLQCLGTRNAEKSFAVAFKRWAADDTFDVVLGETHTAAHAKPVEIPVRFERNPKGSWTIASNVDLAAEGFVCRERTGSVDSSRRAP